MFIIYWDGSDSFFKLLGCGILLSIDSTGNTVIKEW